MVEKGIEGENVLSVQMFDGFSLKWRGKELLGGPKSRGSQSACLLQLLLHRHKEGISRDRLEKALFEGREIDDIRHAVRSIIYNTKKKLKAAGLPVCDYIRQKSGMFYWTEEIAVEEDAECFEQLVSQAAGEEPEKRLEYLLRACECYKGEFLPGQAGSIWAAQEARRYQGMFFSCVEEAVILLRIQEDWPRMKELGLHAAKVSPFADWEVVTMEALVSMGQTGAARKLYDDTVALYIEEQGVRPSKKLLENLGNGLHRRYEVLDAIQSDLSEENAERGGGYLCSYPVFRGLYQMTGRVMERGGQSVYLMLCTLVDGKGNPIQEGPILEELSRRMEEAICRSVRRGDAVSRYGRGQYLVLLMNTTRENCTVVQRRINYHFIVGRQRTRIEYYVNSIICPTGDESKLAADV